MDGRDDENQVIKRTGGAAPVTAVTLGAPVEQLIE